MGFDLRDYGSVSPVIINLIGDFFGGVIKGCAQRVAFVFSSAQFVDSLHGLGHFSKLIHGEIRKFLRLITIEGLPHPGGDDVLGHVVGILHGLHGIHLYRQPVPVELSLLAFVVDRKDTVFLGHAQYVGHVLHEVAGVVFHHDRFVGS